MEDPFPPLTEAEARQLKERNQRWVKRVVAIVALVLTTIAVVLVALSLSLGPKIDQLVSESLESKISSKELILGPMRKNAGAVGEAADHSKGS